MRNGLLALALLGTAACSDRPGSEGPDEFSIVPQQPLIIPETNALPAPRPGGINPADPRPRADAIAALGGRG